MIRSTLTVTFLLFILYNLILYLEPQLTVSSQGFWQDNQVKAQNYLYAKPENIGSKIIVGSSMSFMLSNDSLPDYSNLAFLGEGYVTGLELIEKKNIYPDYIFIEINFPSQKKEGGLFNDVLYHPVLSYLRKFMPALRDGKQPILIFSSELEQFFVKRIVEERNRNKYLAIFQRLTEPTPGIGVFRGFEKEFEPKEVEKAFGSLQCFIENMRLHNTRVVFFEMPYYKKIHNSPRSKSLRKLFLQEFPPQEYTYLPFPKEGEYETLDGLHLGEEEARIFTSQFKMMVDSVLLVNDKY